MFFRKFVIFKVEVSLIIDNFFFKVFGLKDKVFSRILEDFRYFSKNGNDYIEIKSYFILIIFIYVV